MLQTFEPCNKAWLEEGQHNENRRNTYILGGKNLVDQGQHKGSSLSASSSGLGQDILSSEGEWDRLCLDGGGLCEVEFGETTQQTVIESQVGKGQVVIDSVGGDLGRLGLGNVCRGGWAGGVFL